MNRHILILLDKTLFRILFWFVVVASKIRKNGAPGEPFVLSEAAHFLVIRPGGLGDAIMTVPTLRAMRAAYPDSHISIICVGKNRAVFDLLTYHDELIQMDTFGAIRKLFNSKFDVVFDLEPFRRTSSILTWFSGAPVRVGFDTGPRRNLYTHLVNYAHDHLFESANMARQLEILRITLTADDTADLRIDLDNAVQHEAMGTLKKHGARGQLIAVAPGVLKPHHRWENRKWADVVKAILRNDDRVTVLLLGGPGDRQDADEVMEFLTDKKRIVDLVGKVSFVQSLAILGKCTVLLASDGGIVYMAASMGCATISLWGPGVMERFKPPGNSHAGIRKDYPCIPCVTWDRLGEFPKCPYNRKCYTGISIEDVSSNYNSLVSYLDSRKHA